ncbi:MAG: hypothetical protein LUD51_02905 [Clostridia bacterium]|nr:hypothetical protein [Clostridia bacterium]
MRYYRVSIPVPEDEGVSIQKRKDGTFVVYRHTEQVTEPEEKDVVRTCTIGRMPWKHFREMYPNDNYGKYFTEYAKFLTDDTAFPEEFWLQPGLFVFLKRSAENCGLMDALRRCFEDEDTVNEIMDLAIYLANSGGHRENLDEYLKKAPLMTDDWYDAEEIMNSVRKKVQIRQIREFAKTWAASQKTEGYEKPFVYLYLDTSFWGRLFGGWFRLSGTETRLNPDVEGPKGFLPELNFILGLRIPDGMPLFYKDTGFDASVNIYDAGAALAKKHHAKSFTFLLKDPDAIEEEIAKMDAAGYNYLFRVQHNPVKCEECVRTVEDESLFFYKDEELDSEDTEGTADAEAAEAAEATETTEGPEENADGEDGPDGEAEETLYVHTYIREPFTFAAETETTYGSRAGWMYVYYNLNEQKGDRDAVDDVVRWKKDTAEKCIGKTREELEKEGHTPESIEYYSFTWGKKNGKEVVLSYELDEEAVKRGKYLAGMTCYFTTTGGLYEYALAFVDDASYYSSIIESEGLNTRDDMNQLSSNEDLSLCWKDRNNEIESFIKFVACILLHTVQKAGEDAGLEDRDDSTISVYSGRESLNRIIAIRGKRGKFHLEYPLDYYQTELFKAIGMSLEDFTKEMEEAGDNYVRRILPW